MSSQRERKSFEYVRYLWQDVVAKIRAMRPINLDRPERGPKTEIEDATHPMYSHCVYGLDPRAGSTDTPLRMRVESRYLAGSGETI